MWHVWDRSACRVLVGKPVGKKPFRKPKHRWEYNIIRNKMERRGLDLSRSG
jgi:hypothetical protein